MPRIQELLVGRDNRIDYTELKRRYPWIISENQKCIISPDSDGLLCGLFMSKYLNWDIVGFYDGKVMLLKDGISSQDCIFLDMEIFRVNIKSMGHHMLRYNRNNLPSNWGNFTNCIQPNNLRNYDKYHDFRLKYPLATIHMLMGIIGSEIDINTPESAICPLFFTDGTFNVMFGYPENVLNWLKYLRADEEESPLKTIFENTHYSTFSLIVAMDNFFRRRDQISISKERGDRLRISTTDGEPFNIISIGGNKYKLNDSAKSRIIRFINLLSELTTWEYLPNKWCWDNFRLFKFTKRDFNGRSLNGSSYNEVLSQNPLSWAITSNINMEYTLETPDRLP